jgi:hypothetical protein
MLFLASAAPALAADPSPAERAARPDRPERADARSPLAAMGGSTFDPRHLTGAVTFDRLIQGLASDRGMPSGLNEETVANATRLAAEVIQPGAIGAARLSPDQLAHLRIAMGRSGVPFEYRMMMARKIALSEGFCRTMEVEGQKPGTCFSYALLGTLEEPTYLLGQMTHRATRDATFVLSRPTELRLAREAAMGKASCGAEGDWGDRALKQTARESVAALDGMDRGMDSGLVTLLQVSALIDPRMLEQVLGKDGDLKKGAVAAFRSSCMRSTVWTFEVPRQVNAQYLGSSGNPTVLEAR